MDSIITSLLKGSLRPSGRLSRFWLDTFVTPSVYLSVTNLYINNQDVSFQKFEQMMLKAVHPDKPGAVPLPSLEKNIRFRSWVRKAFLMKKYGDGSGLNVLNLPGVRGMDDPARRWKSAQNMCLSQDKLPKYNDVLSLFSIARWNRTQNANDDAEKDKLVQVTEDDRGNRQITPVCDTKPWHLEHVLESVGCCVYGMNAFNLFCEQNAVYEVLTKEYVDELADYIVSRSADTMAHKARAADVQVATGDQEEATNTSDPLDGTNPSDSVKATTPSDQLEATSPSNQTNPNIFDSKHHVTILEVGAGDGRLSHFLRQSLNERVKPQRVDQLDSKRRKRKGSQHSTDENTAAPLPAFRVVATDSGQWHLPVRQAGVEKIGYLDAVEKYKPDIVLCSWMPMGDDWTAAFRAQSSVNEYILVGETDRGCCGHPWKTWGYKEPVNASTSVSGDEESRPSVDIFDWISRLGTASERTFGKKPNVKVDTPEVTKAVPYAADGFSRHLVESPTRYQLSIYDRSIFALNSKTVSFRRGE